MMKGLRKTVLLSNFGVIVESQSSRIVNTLRFRFHSGLELWQNPWFCKPLDESVS